MLIEENDGFQKVCRKKKINSQNVLISKNNNQSSTQKPQNCDSIFQDDGIGGCSPTESEESIECHRQGQTNNGKNKKKRKRKRNKKGGNLGSSQPQNNNNYEHDSDQDEEHNSDKDTNTTTGTPIIHRRRRHSSNYDNASDSHECRQVHWLPELVTDRTRTSSTGSILVKKEKDWGTQNYYCDCGEDPCDCCQDTSVEWIQRSMRWQPRFKNLSELTKSELVNIEDKLYFCDNQYHLKLGSGNNVYFGLTPEGREVIVRKLKTKQSPELQKPKCVRQLLEIRHPNLAKIEQFIILKNQSYMLTEVIDYNLRNWIKKETLVNSVTPIEVCRQMCNGLQYLHYQNPPIAHKDLRPTNVLITPVGRVIISNFGCAPINTLNKQKSVEKRIADITLASPEVWRSAEQLWEITGDYKVESDLPPLGMLIFATLTKGQHPYGLTRKKDSGQEAVKNIIAPRYNLNALNGNIIAKELVRGLLHKDPSHRGTIKDVLRNPIFWNEERCVKHMSYILQNVHSKVYLDKKNERQLIPSCGHFGDLPDELGFCRDAESSEELLALLEDFCAKTDPSDGVIGTVEKHRNFIKSVLLHFPAIISMTHKYGPDETDEDFNDTDSSAKTSEMESHCEFGDFD